MSTRTAQAQSKREEEEREEGAGTNHFHRVPLLAEDLAHVAGAHHLVRGGDLRAPFAGEDHERVHGPLGGPVCVEGLGCERMVRVVCGRRGSVMMEDKNDDDENEDDEEREERRRHTRGGLVVAGVAGMVVEGGAGLGV